MLHTGLAPASLYRWQLTAGLNLVSLEHIAPHCKTYKVTAALVCQASHSYVSTNWNSYYAGRHENTDPCPRCCLAEECIKKDKGRYTILTTLRTDKYLPLLVVSCPETHMSTASLLARLHPLVGIPHMDLASSTSHSTCGHACLLGYD